MYSRDFYRLQTDAPIPLSAPWAIACFLIPYFAPLSPRHEGYILIMDYSASRATWQSLFRYGRHGQYGHVRQGYVFHDTRAERNHNTLGSHAHQCMFGLIISASLLSHSLSHIVSCALRFFFYNRIIVT